MGGGREGGRRRSGPRRYAQWRRKQCGSVERSGVRRTAVGGVQAKKRCCAGGAARACAAAAAVCARCAARRCCRRFSRAGGAPLVVVAQRVHDGLGHAAPLAALVTLDPAIHALLLLGRVGRGRHRFVLHTTLFVSQHTHTRSRTHRRSRFQRACAKAVVKKRVGGVLLLVQPLRRGATDAAPSLQCARTGVLAAGAQPRCKLMSRKRLVHVKCID